MADGCNHFGFSGASGHFEMAAAIPGPPGKSAYEAAVEGGYTGTEEQFNAALAEVDTALQPSDVDAELSASSTNPVQNRVVTGALDGLKSALDNTIETAAYSKLSFDLLMDRGVNPSTGANYNNVPRYARTEMISLVTNRTVIVGLCDDTYEYVAWCYSGLGTATATYSPTGQKFVSGWTFIPFTTNERAFRIGIQRKDHAGMTSGEGDTDETRLKAALRFIHVPSTGDFAHSIALNNTLAKTGGSFHPILRQGSGNFNSTYYEEVPALTVCGTPKEALLFLHKGDRIEFDDLQIAVSVVEITENGIIRKRQLASWSESPVVVNETGIFLALFRYSDTTQVIPVSTAMSKVTVYHNPAHPIITLPKNPYKHIATAKNSDTGAYTWSDRVHDIKSTCHLHTAKALYFTRARLAGYDHIAISNYHASKPTVPISDIITELDGYDATRDAIPAGWLESPNAEHVYFGDADAYVGSSAGSHLHMCSVGSYITSGADNTGVGEGGFDGTVKEFSEEAERLLKYTNGGGLTINHPKWSGIDASGIINLLSLGNVFGMEIYNASSEHLNQKGYSLELWDSVLSQGWQIFGTAVPDHETEGSFWADHLPLGFVHLLCITESEQEIMLAYRNGRSYCTIANDALMLKYFNVDSNGLATVTASESGTIKFVTATRSVTVENNNTATFQTQSNDVYVRAEIETATNRLFTNAIML